MPQKQPNQLPTGKRPEAPPGPPIRAESLQDRREQWNHTQPTQAEYADRVKPGRLDCEFRSPGIDWNEEPLSRLQVLALGIVIGFVLGSIIVSALRAVLPGGAL